VFDVRAFQDFLDELHLVRIVLLHAERSVEQEDDMSGRFPWPRIAAPDWWEEKRGQESRR
jgi:hypothetical protein